MSDFKSAFSSKDYFGKVFTYQNSKPQPLAALEYYILAEDYFVNLSYTSAFFGELENRAVENLLPFKKEPLPLNTASFNVSKFTGYSSVDEAIMNVERLMGSFVETFYAATKATCALYTSRTPDGQSELLLLCLPTVLDENAKVKSNHAQDQEVKSVFFGLLWDMGFLTEQQLYDNGLMLGGHNSRISGRKSPDNKGPKL